MVTAAPSPPNHTLIMNEPDFLEEILQGNLDAVAFCRSLGFISQRWDDLVDGDKEVPPDVINDVFFEALVRLPQNPFYRKYFLTLQPMIQMVIQDWLDSNSLEKGTKHEKTLSFVYRDRLTSIFVQCALIVGGYDWAQEVGPKIRRYFHDETLETYTKGLK